MSLLNEFSIQLYTLRAETEKDFAATIRKVADVGYTGVEFAGYGGLSAHEMKSLLSECELAPVGSHVALERLETALDEELEYNREIGTQNIVVPYAVMDSVEDVRSLALRLRALVPKVRRAGFGFAYHNHNQEFKKCGDEYLIDILLSLIPADELDSEFDIYWAAYAGVDYMDWMNKNADRIKLFHVKQIKDFESRKCVDLGDGAIDFGKVIETGKEIGVRHFILEQEDFAVSPYDSVKNGFDYIMNLKGNVL